MTRIFTIILLFICFILLFLLFLNRGSSKIQEAIVVVTTVIIGASLYVCKPYQLEKNITSVFFVDQKERSDNKILFFSEVPILNRFYIDDEFIYENYINKSTKDKVTVKFDFHNDHSPIIELQNIAILERLFELYNKSWYAKREITLLPGGKQIISGPKIATDSQKDITKYSIDDLAISMKSNRFFREPMIYKNLIVPKNTKITFREVGSKKNRYEFGFKKNFFFDIKIMVFFSGGMIGLGELGDFIGVTNPDRLYTDTGDKNVKNYFTYNLKIICQAKFNGITAGNPNTSKYKEWANDMFDNLYQTFDWTVCRDAILNYQKNKAIQKILNLSKIKDNKS